MTTTFTPNQKLPKPAFGAANWHTDMYNALDAIDALFTTFTSIASMKGVWVNSTAYVVGDTVVDTVAGALYECDVAHTSAASGTFSEDRTANPTYWTVSSFSARALAEKWADEDEDVPVETGKFSARHWATKAAAIVGVADGTLIQDTDTDTFVKTEVTADEDKVRINTAGVERVVIDSNGLNATTLIEDGTSLVSKYTGIAHATNTANPHSVTKAQVGLTNVTDNAQLKIASNLSDLNSVASARSNLGLANHSTITVDSSGNARLTGGIQHVKGSDVASAATLMPADGNIFDVTGTTTITAIGSIAVGTIIHLQFDGIVTLTHHATDLILPGGQNIVTAAGDIGIFEEYASGDWRCVSYQRAAGAIDGWVKIGTTTTFSATATFDLALSAAFRKYHIVLDEVLPATDLVRLDALLGDGTIHSSGYWNVVKRSSGSDDTTQAQSTASVIKLMYDNNAGSAAGEGISGDIYIQGHQNASGQAFVTGDIGLLLNNTPTQFDAKGRYATNGAITDFQMKFSSGNIASGRATVYGLLA